MLLVEVPPVKNIVLKLEAQDLNRYLKDITTRYENVTMVETWEALRDVHPNNIFKDDGYHYDPKKEGAEIVANLINKAVEKAAASTGKDEQQGQNDSTNSSKPSRTTTTKELRIRPGTASYFIGKGGNRVKEMQHELHVEIQFPDKENKILIIGEPRRMQRAEDEINKILEDYEKERARRSQIICNNHKRGHCSYGDTCHFKHENRERNREEGRSRPSQRSRSPQHHRSRSDVRRGSGRWAHE